MDTTVPKSPDIPEPPPGSVVLDNRGLAWQRGVHEQDDPNRWYESGANRDLPYGRLNEDHGPLTVVYTPQPAEPAANEGCTGCGRPIHRVHGMWIDDLGRGHCPSGAKQGVNSHSPAAAPALAVYVIEQRTNLAAGGHAFQLLPAGFAYPSIPNAQAAVEYMAGAMAWNDRLEARQPGDRLPLYRIVEVPLATTQGGVR